MGNESILFELCGSFHILVFMPFFIVTGTRFNFPADILEKDI
jgi:hypothetical protein